MCNKHAIAHNLINIRNRIYNYLKSRAKSPILFYTELWTKNEPYYKAEVFDDVTFRHFAISWEEAVKFWLAASDW